MSECPDAEHGAQPSSEVDVGLGYYGLSDTLVVKFSRVPSFRIRYIED